MTRKPFVPHARRLYTGLIVALIAGLILPLTPSMPARADIAPVLHLPLDEAAGATTFADLSVYNHPGACSGASCPTAGVAGKTGQAAQFDGADDVITVSNAPTPTVFSLSLWFQWDDVGTANVQFLTGKGVGNMELHTGGSAGVNGLRFIPAGSSTIVDAPNAIVSGWNHVAATYDGSTAQVYVNGVQEASRTGITGGNDLSADATPLNLGRRSDNSFYFKGRLDDVRVYDRVLSPAEVAVLAEKPLALSKAVVPGSNVPYHGVVTYTVTLLNVGAISQTNVLVTDTLPAQVAFAGWVNTPPANTVRAGQTLTWTGDIQAGQTLTWTWTATHTGDYGETVNNTAYMQGVTQTSHASAAFSVGCGPAITVQNTNDSGPGSLREAISASSLCPGGVIDFAPDLSGQTITLASELAIARHLTIDGSALPVTITLSGNHAVRILYISSGAHVTLNRLQFIYGAVNAYNDGGGLYIASGAVVTLTHSAVLSCTAGWGGGITNMQGTLTVQHSTFAGNSGGDIGGGIYSIGGGTLTVQDSTFIGNSVTGSGGGLASEESTLTVRDSTFYGNSAWGGGGLYSYQDTRTVQNNTFVANAAYRGGGLYSALGTLTMENCTVAGNWAGNVGGGLYGNFILHNTIVWGNTADTGDAQISTPGSTLYDSVVQGGCPATGAGCVNVLSSDPRLGALGDYGGSTSTVPLLPGSSALDAGNDGTCLLTDQRGVARPQGTHCDIGAFESHGFILSVAGGDRQTTRIKTAFPNALVVSVVGRNAVDPVENGVLTFNAPTSGASATPVAGTLTIVGNSAAQGLTANGLAGTFAVTVTSSGVLTPATFVLTNTDKYVAAVALASTPNPSGYGQTVFLTATVGGDSGLPTGSVSFTADGSVISGCDARPLDGSGQTTCALAALAGGVHNLRAEYGGDANYSPSASPVYIQVVGPGGLAPVAVSDIYTTPQDAALAVLAPGVLDNDSDPDGDRLTAALVTQPMHGEAGLNSNGALLYLPAPGFVGQDAFDYAASDGVLTATARITVNVTAVNHPVVAHDDIAVMREDETLVVWAPGVLANDADPDGDPLTAELLTSPFTGTATLAASGAYTYTPPLNFNDVVSFTYRVRDPGNLSATATVYILVQAVNDAPTFTSLPGLAATQEQPYTYAVTTADPDLRQGDRLILTAVILPTWLTLTDSGGAGELGGIPSQADVGDHTVLLRVTDRAGAFAEQEFVITVDRKSSYYVYLPLAIKNKP